ncbi:hypothetical protein B7P43_G02047 [Cryptotermes secundus]|uniref:Uncharacterized protein n=1 Tax=Cryptotermes secundus TaxID=105785 RepID=A0A2J7RLU6_9NEOP|nr:hypothetical protein B7P43_G02047 [Cryptotermes secundus]
MKKTPPGPARTVRTPENIARVREALIRSPRRSARRHATELRAHREAVKRILQNDLRLHPYKKQIFQQLKVRDYAQREDFAVRTQLIFEGNENALVIMSDETHFHLNGTVNKQNLRYWASKNPRHIHQRSFHSQGATVGCVVAFRAYKTIILPVVLNGSQTWSLSLREEYRLRVFENRVLRRIFGPKRDEVTGVLRKLPNEELHNLYSSPSIIRNIKSRRMRWVGYVAGTEEKWNAHRILVGKPEGKRPLGRPICRWMDNIIMNLREIEWDEMH